MEASSSYDLVQSPLMRNAIKAILLLSISACATVTETAGTPNHSTSPSSSGEELEQRSAQASTPPAVETVALSSPAILKSSSESGPQELAEEPETYPSERAEKDESKQTDSLPIPKCINPGEKNVRGTKSERQETRARVKAICEELGASPIVCAYMDAVVIRESSGRAGVRHYKGHNENGLGAMGLSLRWHKDKWPGEDEDPMFCHPEVSAIVALAIMHRAMERYKAKNIVEIQAIYSGKWHCEGEGRDRKCSPKVSKRTINVCGRMSARGFDCWKTLTKNDLGRKIPFDERRDFVADMIAKFGVSGPSS